MIHVQHDGIFVFKKGVSLIIWRFLVFLIEKTKRIYFNIYIYTCVRDVWRNTYVEQSLLSLYQGHQYQMVSIIFEKDWLATNLIEHKIGKNHMITSCFEV